MDNGEAPLTDAAYREFYRQSYRPFLAGLGRALRQAREEWGFSRAELAGLTHTHEDIVKGIEEGAANIEPSLSFLLLASRALGRARAGRIGPADRV